MRSGQPLVVSLTSVATDAGQSVAALALARVAARSGLRTLLIDGDLGRLVPATASGGLVAVVNGAPLNGAVLKDRRSNAYCLAAPAGVWPQAAGVLRSLCHSCDLVLINAPALGAAGAWPALAGLSDVVLLLAAANAPQGVFDQTLRSLVAMRAPLRGLVIMR
jgi:hypothetical protein